MEAARVGERKLAIIRKLAIPEDLTCVSERGRRRAQ